MNQTNPWDELASLPAPEMPVFAYAETRDWPGYFRATQGRAPRATCLEVLDLFDAEGVPGGSGPRPLAVDLGCGEGRDSAEMLARGWRVLAIDGNEMALDLLRHRPNITDHTHLAARLEKMENVHLPACNLVNASFCLPFCHPDRFDSLWERIVTAILPGGRFAGQLFGERDSWAVLPDRSHQTRQRVEKLLSGLKIERLDEEERDGEDCHGTAKHWHAFHIIARKP